jgi:hypothetical protein
MNIDVVLEMEKMGLWSDLENTDSSYRSADCGEKGREP